MSEYINQITSMFSMVYPCFMLGFHGFLVVQPLFLPWPRAHPPAAAAPWPAHPCRRRWGPPHRCGQRPLGSVAPGGQWNWGWRWVFNGELLMGMRTWWCSLNEQHERSMDHYWNWWLQRTNSEQFYGYLMDNCRWDGKNNWQNTMKLMHDIVQLMLIIKSHDHGENWWIIADGNLSTNKRGPTSMVSVKR